MSQWLKHECFVGSSSFSVEFSAFNRCPEFYEVFFELVIINYEPSLSLEFDRLLGSSIWRRGVWCQGVSLNSHEVFFPQDDVQYDELIQRIKKEAGLTFFYIFFLFESHIFLTTPPKKTNEHGSPWKMMSKFCISFPRVPTLRKPNPLVFSGSFFGCKPVKLILPCCCQTRWPIFFGGVVSWVAGFRAFRDFYIEVMMIWRIGGQNQKPTNFIKQPADIALMYNGFCLYLRL